MLLYLPLQYVKNFAIYLSTEGVDWNDGSLNLTITGGSTTLSCIQVLINDDTMEESCSNEFFQVNLAALSPRVNIDIASAPVYIIDDDLPGGRFSSRCLWAESCLRFIVLINIVHT